MCQMYENQEYLSKNVAFNIFLEKMKLQICLFVFIIILIIYIIFRLCCKILYLI